MARLLDQYVSTAGRDLSTPESNLGYIRRTIKPLRNTAAARLGNSGGGATTLRHYADPVPEVDRRAATHLAQLTVRSATHSG